MDNSLTKLSIRDLNRLLQNAMHPTTVNRASHTVREGSIYQDILVSKYKPYTPDGIINADCYSATQDTQFVYVYGSTEDKKDLLYEWDDIYEGKTISYIFVDNLRNTTIDNILRSESIVCKNSIKLVPVILILRTLSDNLKDQFSPSSIEEYMGDTPIGNYTDSVAYVYNLLDEQFDYTSLNDVIKMLIYIDKYYTKIKDFAEYISLNR